MVLVYFKGSSPDATEAKLIEKLQSGSVDFRTRNSSRWKGETEACLEVHTAVAAVEKAYKAAGVKVTKIGAVKKAAKAKAKTAK